MFLIVQLMCVFLRKAEFMLSTSVITVSEYSNFFYYSRSWYIPFYYSYLCYFTYLNFTFKIFLTFFIAPLLLKRLVMVDVFVRNIVPWSYRSSTSIRTYRTLSISLLWLDIFRWRYSSSLLPSSSTRWSLLFLNWHHLSLLDSFFSPLLLSFELF